MARGGDAIGRRKPLRERTAFFDAHVHFGVTFHDALDSFVGLFSCFADKLRRKKNSEKHCDDHHHQQPAREFSERKLPAHQHDENDAQLCNQVRGSNFKRHRRSEIGAFAKNRACQRDGGVGTGR